MAVKACAALFGFCALYGSTALLTGCCLVRIYPVIGFTFSAFDFFLGHHVTPIRFDIVGVRSPDT